MNIRTQIVHIEPQEELAEVIEKILTQEAERVFLVVSEDSRLASNILNFRLIHREAESAGKEIVIVSSHPRVQSIATKAGLQVHQETESMRVGGSAPKAHPQMADIVSPKSFKERTEIEESKEEIQDKKLESIFQPLKPKLPPRQMWQWPRLTRPRLRLRAPGRKMILLVLAVLLSVMAYFVYTALPRVMVIAVPFEEEEEATVDFAADINVSVVSYDKRIVPAQLLEEQKTLRITREATGEETVEARAEGKIKVYNEFSSSPQTLVATTRFVSQDGKLFRTLNTIVVPGARIENGEIIPSFTDVAVRAAKAGEDYNIGPSTFSIPGFKGSPKYTAFYGKSEEAMKGGFVGTRKIVTEEDILRAREEVRTKLAGLAEQILRGKIPQSLKIINGSLREDVEIENVTAEAGEAKEEFAVSGRATAQVILFDEQDIKDILKDVFAERFAGADDLKLVEVGNINYTIEKMDFSKGLMRAKASSNLIIGKKVAPQDLARKLLGKSEGEVRRFLSSHPDISRAEVRFWPFWVAKVPEDLSRVKIEVQY